MSRSEILALAGHRVVEGWEVDYFLGQALRRRTYPDLQSVMSDLESWLENLG